MLARAPSCPISAIVTALIVGTLTTPALAQTTLLPRVTLADTLIRDQDDMCIWIHPTDRSLSTIITSDKHAGMVFVYDLQGIALQVVPVAGTPGNIDIRYNFELSGGRADIVAFNGHSNDRIEVYRVDPSTRLLARVDNGAINTGANYGFCLYRSPISGIVYAFTPAEDGNIEQYELRDEGGQVAATRVRSWDIGGRTEGCVCDDETGFAYFGEEDVGIWKVGAEPSDSVTGSLIARKGDPSGLASDVEGLTIYYAAGGRGYLMASSQGSSDFKVYERLPPHNHVATFSMLGVTRTDGIDVINVSLGPAFPSGIITAHNHTPYRKTVEVCAYEDAGLLIDTEYWNPRDPDTTRATLAPVIAAFNPASGPVGTEVTLTGVRFTGAAAVGFNGRPATGFTVESDTLIGVTVPAGATTGRITVTSPEGSGTSATDFVVPAPPAISSFAPPSGPVGTQVTIAGTGFTGASAVTFNNVAASNYTVGSDTLMRATVPAGATTGPIRVTNGVGTATSASSFVVTAAPSQLSFGTSDDARVISTTPSGNYGTVMELRVRSVDPTYYSYLKFNVTGLSGTIQNAKLRLYCNNESGDGGRVYLVSNHYLGTTTPWVESGLTYSNAPAIGGTPLDQQGAVGLNSWVEFNVTSAISGNGVYSLGLWSGSTNIAGYSSKEADSNRPELVIEQSSGTPPAIASFTPTGGSVGTEVTVLGTGFATAGAVGFNGSAAPFTVESDTLMRATVPVGASTGPITVTNPAGIATSTQSFTVMTPPVITFFDPTSGSADTPVDIHGAHFATATALAFSGTAATFTVESDTLLHATVPAGSGAGPISVTNSDGTSTSSQSFIVITAPAIRFFVPTSGPVGTAVDVHGSGLASVSAVTFNGTAGGFTIESDTLLHATVPADAGSGPIGVTNPMDSTTSTQSFTVTTPPAITSFDPASGPVGTTVDVHGVHFGSATGVAFNGAAAGFTIDGDTLLHTTVPADATTGPIGVTNSDGTATSTADFVVVLPPTITSFDPTIGGVGTWVTIVGSEFIGTTAVTFDTAQATEFTVDNPTRLRARVPVGASSGPIAVTNPASTATSTQSFTVTTPLPSTWSFSPTYDAQVHSGNPTTNYGSLSTLRAKDEATDYRFYLQFDVQGPTGPAQSASLRLYVTDPSPVGGSIFLASNQYLGSTTPWTESGITWSNAPELLGSALSGLGSVSVGTWAQFDVTPAITGSGIFSFGVTSGHTNSVYYSSKEGARPPVLEVQATSLQKLEPISSGAREALPSLFEVRPARPNPFAWSTVIPYGLPHADRVRLTIYNVAGQLVRRLLDRDEVAGFGQVTWDGTDAHGRLAPPGLYLYRLEFGGQWRGGRLVLLR